jgi:lipopolysaccharide export system permease protein
MKTLHFYLTRQTVATLLMTVVVFTFVLMLATVLKEVLGLLVSGKTSFATVAEAVLLLIPFVLVFALPMGLLTATLLVFGRLSADQELTAVRAGGISLVALITPVLLLSVALSGLCAIINLEIAPRCRVARELLIPVVAQSSLLLPEKTYIRHFTNSIVYISKVRGPISRMCSFTHSRGKRWTGTSGQIVAHSGSIPKRMSWRCVCSISLASN